MECKDSVIRLMLTINRIYQCGAESGRNGFIWIQRYKMKSLTKKKGFGSDFILIFFIIWFEINLVIFIDLSPDPD